ncbi:natterin-3-like isoform X2 [Notolabrus celidotus]|uniref:natterin-3-like isoform X2 n=1 Tax=Notolabrus celidotus TaxID=1203425 RepID=UPI00148F76A2|nr:natterin-3-like isoform X2 [Notolabrus celidotus]
MKLSVLMMSALLALSSAALQEEEEEGENPPPEEDLEDRVPGITANGSLLALLTPSEVEKKKSGQPLSSTSTLRWQTMNGSVPVDAVVMYNSYTKRYDYVCKYGCYAGFFNPSMGAYCRYALSGREKLGSPFEMLVNKDNFEILEWKGGSWGRVPEHSVKTCSDYDVYVGRNRFGLGKVHARRKAFFLPWKGRGKWYRTYQVLTVNKNFYKEEVHSVRFNTNFTVTEHPPEIMTQSTIVNNECLHVDKTLTLTKTHEKQSRWDTSIGTRSGISSTITARIPFIGSLGISLSLEKTNQFSSGVTVTKSVTSSVSIMQTIPPNHSCKVSLVGRRYEADIPFTAILTRKYRDGRITSVSITGTFTGVNVDDIHSVVDRCSPIPNASPCP